MQWELQFWSICFGTSKCFSVGPICHKENRAWYFVLKTSYTNGDIA